MESIDKLSPPWYHGSMDARKYKEARAGTRTRRSKLINLES
eukprot:SAG22_NODE_11770_length_470_cov_0.752022_1_plen_40_part_01